MRSALSIVVVGVVALSAVAAVPAAAGASAPASDVTMDRSPASATQGGLAATTTGTADGDATDTGTASGLGSALSHGDACEPVANGTAPDNPESDRLGWENGCWYNESITVTRGDGLNETELDAVVGRAMARVEAVRQLEFERSVPVEVVSREEYRQDRESDNSSTSTANFLHQNVKWEAMFSIGEDQDALAAFESTQTATVGGFYNFVEDRIVIISENATTPKIDEITLSQELFHALQDQKLKISFNRSTREGLNAGNGIVEGDGNLVDRFYEQRCESEWDCLLPLPSNGGGGNTSSINYGVYLTQFQPYSDGPKFVRGIYNEGGWEAVNAVYENPPTSTEQVIHPEKYPDEGPAEITFTDRSSADWTIPDLGEGSVDYATFGEAGLAAMMMRPVFATGGAEQPVVGPQDFYNLTSTGQVSDFDPLVYDLEPTNGWGNDRLYPYVTDDSAETNETGYVWKTLWDTEGDAEEFVGGYEAVLEHYGASAVDGRANTYRIPDEETFGDAFYVNRTGSTVWLVNAPTVDQLDDVRAGAAPQVETPTPSPTPTDSPTPSATPTPTDTPTDSPTPTEGMDGGTPTDATGDDTPTPTTESGGGGPGFGVAVALAALVLTAVALRRRR